MVKEAIESVLAQTYTDYEIIVVDDGSTDNTREVAATLSAKVRYVYQQNQGRSNARNHGIRLARGTYIAFLDSDDLFLPTKLEKQVALMERNPEILLSHTSYARMSAEREHIVVTSGDFSGCVYPQVLLWCPIATPTVMIRREALGENTRFLEHISVGEDIILWAQLAKQSNILGIDEPLTKVRVREGNVAFDRQAQIAGLMNIIEYAVKREQSLRPATRRELLSGIYLAIGYNHLRKMEGIRFLKFLLLAIRNQPFSAMGRLSRFPLRLCGKFVGLNAKHMRRRSKPASIDEVGAARPQNTE